jgi:hypothetical protein
VKTSPILSAPITLSTNQGVAYDVLKQILAQVHQATGYRVDIGSVPVNALAMARVTIDAVREPANHVLMWLLNGILSYPQLLPSKSPSFAYHVLYDPKLKYYLFNIVEVAPELSTHTMPAQPLAPSQPRQPNRWAVSQQKP